MYMAFITRASKGESDNSDIIEEIRKLRYSIQCTCHKMSRAPQLYMYMYNMKG